MSFFQNDKAIELAEELLAVEMLEYHNKNWLGGNNKVRSEKKQRLIRELIKVLQTVEISESGQKFEVVREAFLRP